MGHAHAIDLAVLFSGAVVTETVFAWPGMGSLLVESVYRRDYSVLRLELSRAEHDLLRTLIDGVPLGEALAAAADQKSARKQDRVRTPLEQDRHVPIPQLQGQTAAHLAPARIGVQGSTQRPRSLF